MKWPRTMARTPAFVYADDDRTRKIEMMDVCVNLGFMHISVIFVKSSQRSWRNFMRKIYAQKFSTIVSQALPAAVPPQSVSQWRVF